ncbi:MAG: iron-containing alcohol dehydrogenase [Chloroflexi bacterium]|nr:iron-containing alcohol dehydrogenase [Chloroflexota bacterium]
MPMYSVRLPPVIHAGDGAVARLPGEVARLGRRPLLVTDPVVGRQPFLPALAAALAAAGLALARFDDLPGEPTTREVDAGLAAVRAHGADVIVAIGGGSVIDTAKAVAAMATHAGRIADYQGSERFRHDRLPLVAVATTAGTGSEVTRFTVITDPDTNVKMLITDARLVPDVAIADPVLTHGCPRPVTASTGMDALTHAIEAYVSQRATPSSDLFALAAVRQIGGWLERAWTDGNDAAARSQVMIGALHAGIAFSNASVALVHGRSRPIGAYFHVPHGIANAMLLPVVLRYSVPAAPERYRDLALAAGLDDGLPAVAGDRFADWITDLALRLAVPSLRGYGLDPADVRRLAPRMAADAVASGSPANNPRVPTESEIVALYEQAL